MCQRLTLEEVLSDHRTERFPLGAADRRFPFLIGWRTMAVDVKLRGTLRALAVIQALNRRHDATIMELQQITGIPRPSLYRVIQTLSSTGYIRQVSEHGYGLTYLVRSLSDGFLDEEWVCEIAAPVLGELQREILWPTDLATFLNYSLYLRETTRRHSPFTIDRATVGYRLSLLRTALGRAYLAFCPDGERKAILEHLAESKDPLDALARQPRAVEKIIHETKAKGYGARFKVDIAETGSIAIPINLEGRVIACLGMTFIASALTPEQAAKRYLGNLMQAKARIEKALRPQTAR
jgi:IclR family mhp operon transcriptional activator